MGDWTPSIRLTGVRPATRQRDENVIDSASDSQTDSMGDIVVDSLSVCATA